MLNINKKSDDAVYIQIAPVGDNQLSNTPIEILVYP
jgi:hypothetical protein